MFYSANDEEIETVSKRFNQAGIACQVRRHSQLAPKRLQSSESEVWIRHDRDCHRALMLCVELNIGFARRREAEIELAD